MEIKCMSADRRFKSVKECLEYIGSSFPISAGDSIEFSNDTGDSFDEEITAVNVYNSYHRVIAEYEIGEED